MGNDQSHPVQQAPRSTRGRGRGRGRGRPPRYRNRVAPQPSAGAPPTSSGAPSRAPPTSSGAPQEEVITHYRAQPAPPSSMVRAPLASDPTFRIDPYQQVSRSTRGGVEEMRFNPGMIQARPDPAQRQIPSTQVSSSRGGGAPTGASEPRGGAEQSKKNDYKPYPQLRCGNPYQVLGLEEGASFKEVRKRAQRLARKHHPDKGGDPADWDRIEEAYVFLREEHEKSDEYKFKRHVGKQSYSAPEEVKGMVNPELDPKKFDADRFNQVFEQTRLHDPLANGYGDLMEGGGRGLSTGVGGPEGASKLAELKSAPSARGDEEFDDDTCYDLVEYREPMAFMTGGAGFATLDEEGLVSDFTNEFGTDYKRAFHKRSHIDVLPEGAEIEGRPKTLQQYQQARDSISFELSPEDARRQRELERAEEERERERQRRFEARRRAEAEHFGRTHTKMIAYQ